MADQKVSDLPSLNGADVDAADLLYIIDSSAGTAGSKKITVGQYQLAPYSAGTANGVMYLNGSNVVTTGSGLVFDGTNLGLGVTPSAQGVYRTMQFGNYLTIGQQTVGTAQSFFGWNVRGSSTANQYLYNVTADKAALYEIYSDASHRWSVTNTSGTAGNAITFTEAMRLDASGNLGLGVTPSAWVSGSTGLQTGSYTALSNAIGGDSNLTNNVYLSAASTWTAIASLGASRYQLDFGSHKWFTAPSGTAGNAISFTQAMTLTSGGDLLVGTTSSAAYTNGFFANATYINSGHVSGTAGGTGYVLFGYDNASIGSISQNGTTGVLYNTTSDRRLKDNIVPAPSASDVIDAIQIVSHNWKSAPDEHVTYGVIAQDLHAVAPEAVTPGDDGDEIEKTWGVDYSKLVPMLIKEIQSLRARVAALEAQ